MAVAKRDIVRNRLRQLIHEGRLGADGPLPPVRQLCGILGASLRTVHEAIQLLKHEKLIESHGRRGNHVSPQRAVGLRVAIVGPEITPTYMKGDSPGWPGAVLNPLRDALAEAGGSVRMFPMSSERHVWDLTELQNYGPSAIILFEIHSELSIADFLSLRLPLVSVDHDATGLGIPSVVLDNAWGTFAAAQALIDRGHQRIAYLHPPAGSLTRAFTGVNPHHQMVTASAMTRRIIEERAVGIRLAVRQANLPEISQEMSGEKPAIEQLLKGDEPVTGLVCFDHHCANLAARSITADGLRIPDDVSLISFGSSPIRLAGRSGTRITFNAKAMGKAAANYLSHPEARNSLTRIPVRLSGTSHRSTIAQAPQEILQ